jgi:probable HAF family extracellular repeat protein
MKTWELICTTLTTVLAVLAIADAAAAQAPTAKHHHYKLFDLGTFGGPQSYINQGGEMGFFSNAIGNDQRVFTGWADTSTPDPYPNFCFYYDCLVTHAFQWQNGVRKDLGALPGGASSATTWISANSLIAGTSQNGQIDPLLSGFPELRAVLWQNGKIIDLKTLPEGGYESGSVAVNSSGQVVGWAINTIPDPVSFDLASIVYFNYEPYPYPYQMRAFLWQDGVMRDLGTLGGPDAYPTGINELGQVIGISFTNSTATGIFMTACNFGGLPGGVPPQDPFFWDKDTGMIDLGTFGGTCGYAMGLNNEGQVVGQSNLFGDQANHAFIWDGATGLMDLGTLGGSDSTAFAINDNGEAVGVSNLLGDTQLNAVLWGKNGMVDLGVLSGDNCAWPFWINASGQVVGNGGTNCEGRGFLWENSGPLVDLNSLIVSNDGFSITDAIYINDQGEIIGEGTPSDCTDEGICGHVYVLIPCDASHPNMAGCDYRLVDPASATEARTARATGPSPARRRARTRCPRPK